MTDEQQNEQQEELRDLDVPAGAAQEVKGGKVSVHDASTARCAGKPFITGNHNETLVRSHIVANHNETLVRDGLKGQHNETLVRSYVANNHNETLVRNGMEVQHNETLVLRDLDLREAEAEDVKSGAKPTLAKSAGSSGAHTPVGEDGRGLWRL